MAIKQILASLPYQDPGGVVLANGSLTLDLSQPATATGSGEVAPLRVSITLNSSGTFSATNLWANDQLQPSGTTYRLRTYNSNGLLAADFGNIQITGTSPIDISAIVPSSTNPTTAVTALSLQSLNGVLYADQFSGATADVKMNAAAAALPTGGGTIDCRGFGATTQTIAATVTLSYANKPITWIFDHATTFNVTITNGSVAFNAPASTAAFYWLVFGDSQPNVTTKGITLANSANVSNVFKILTTQFEIDGLQIVGNSLATVTDSVVNLTNTLQTSAVRSLGIGGYANTALLKITQTAGSSVGPFNLYNLSLDGQAVTGCKPLLIQGVSSGGVMLGINFYGGSFTHPGSGGLAIIDIEGITGNETAGVNFFGPQLESVNLSDIGFLINNSTGVSIYSPAFTASGNVGTTCVRITGANTDDIEVVGLNNFSGWTNNVVNTVSSTTITAASQNRLPWYSYTFGTRLSCFWDSGTNGQIMKQDGNSVTMRNGIVTAAAPTVAASQVGIGSTTATSATAGANGAVPAQVAGYLIINVAGTTQKVPYFNS